MTNYTGLRLEPVSALGVNLLENGTVHWNASREFFYPVGEHIRHYHLETNQTQFLFPERFGMNCAEVIKLIDVAVTGNGQFIAISEIYRPNTGILSIYDTESQVAHVHLRHDQCAKFTSLSFSSDGTIIAALGIGKDGKENRAVVWKLGRQVVLIAIFLVPPTVSGLAIDPEDANRMVLYGPNLLASVQYRTVDKQLKTISEAGGFENFTFVPSVPGMFLASSGNTLHAVINDEVMTTVTPVPGHIDLLKAAKHNVFVISENKIHMFKATAAAPYIAPVGPLDLNITGITEFSPSPDGDLAVVFHDESYVGLLDINVGLKVIRQQEEARKGDEVKLNKEEQAEYSQLMQAQINLANDLQQGFFDKSEMQQFIGVFSPLPIRYHTGSIVAIATCPRKPLLATCGGQDRTILVWNLARRCVMASAKLSEPVNSVSFHPSGDLLAVGTSERLLLYSLTFDSLVLRSKWESLSCTCVSFSNGGHLLAAGSLIIRVITTYSGRIVTSLRGHNLSVKSIAWAPNDAFFVSSGLDGNIFKWPAKTWDRELMLSLPSQCINGVLSSYTARDDDSNTAIQNYNVLIATSNNSIYDLGLKVERIPKKALNLTCLSLPVPFSLISGDTRGNLQVIPYPLLPAGETIPFHIGTEVAVHTACVHCIVSSADGQTLFTASEDGSVFVFNIVQPHQIVVAAPATMAVSREEQNFLIERDSFDERQDMLARLREMMNLHRSQFQCAKTKLSEQHSREIAQQKNKWQMTLCSLKKQIYALTNKKVEQENKAIALITEADGMHSTKISSVKSLYESKLAELTEKAAHFMKEKIRIQCQYEEKIHAMTEDFKSKLLDRREAAQKQLELQAVDNADAEKEFKQTERLQKEERLVLMNEHEMEMDEVRKKFEQQIAELNNKIERVRSDLVAKQDLYEGNVESKASYKEAIARTHQEKQELFKEQQHYAEKINVLKNELLARGERVATQTNELMALKSKNEELQKWRTVMDYRLGQMKMKTEPKNKTIDDLHRQISTNETRLRAMKVTSAKDAADLDEMESEINSLYNEVVRVDNMTSKCEATIKTFKNRIHSIYTEVEPENWAAEIRKVHNQYVTSRQIDGEDQSLAETLTEFDRHKEALAAKVLELRMKVEDDTRKTGNSHLKQIKNNEVIIRELQRLRDENKRLKSDLHFAQTKISSLMKSCARESKSLETKVKTMFKSSAAAICQPTQTTQKRMTRSGAVVTVEHFV